MNKFITSMEGFVTKIVSRVYAMGKPPELNGETSQETSMYGSKDMLENIPRNILIVKSCCFGDAIISLSAIKKYKQLYPQVNIDVLCSLRVEAVYQSLDEIRHTYTLPLTGKNLVREILSFKFWQTLLAFIRIMRTNNYQELFDLELYRVYPLLIKALLKIPYSRGFRVEPLAPKNHNQLVERGKDTPEWICFYNLFGLEKQTSSPLKILYPKPKATHKPPSHAILGVVFGSSFNWPQKKWPQEKFIELMKFLHTKNFRLVLLGAPHEREESLHIENELPFEVHNTVGKLDYSDLIDMIHSLQVVVGNDTGTLHLASACGVPSVTLFGPTNP